MPRTFALALLASSALVSAAHARELPTGGQLAAGAATIANPATGPMTITQTSNRAVINWQSFSVGVGDTVNIVQPGSTSALLNRVTGATTSTIAGQIHANGQVFLVNPNGILITATGSVNGAGFVASTLDLNDRQFMAGDITVNGRGGSVINRGSISIAKGGFAALIGGHVDNSGLILAPLGRVALGSGSQATLDLTGDGFLQVAIPAATQGGITMSGRISADGGSVILSTASARDAARLTINLSGTIEAHSVTGHSGAVVLTGGAITLTGARIDVSGATGGGTVRIGGDRQGGGNLAHADTVSIDAASTIDANATVAGNGGSVAVWSDTATQFAGTISARGIGGGNGGNAEVSSHGRLGYTGSTDLTGRSFGTLLLDPFNLTISNAADSNQNGFTATGNDSVINATTLTNALGSANVTISTGSSGLQSGTITVAAPLAWTTGSMLTLNAAGAIALDANITAAAGGLTLASGGTISATGAISVARFTLGGGNWVQNTATLPGFAAGDFRITGGSFLRAAGGDGSSGSPYIVGDVYGLQGIGSSATLLGDNFQLANDVDASGTSAWNAGAGFVPIGNVTTQFTGSLTGAGHVISNLFINQPSISYIGLIGYLGSAGTISGIGMVGGSITGQGVVGGLVGRNDGTVSQSYATGAVNGLGYVGGLIGYNGSTGTVSQSYATGAVNGSSEVGGLVGYSSSTVSQSYATGAVSGSDYVGGLVGTNASNGTVSQSYATGAVNGSFNVGGLNVGDLVGYSSGTVSQSYWDIQTTGQTIGIGGGSTTGATGLTTAAARNSANYASWDFAGIWYQAGDMRPILRSEAAVPVAGVITVSNLHQLELVNINLLGSYRLTADIDASLTSSSNPAGIFGTTGFVPIGNVTTPFTGSLTGAGHVISNLFINQPSINYIGLIGYLGSAGTISDIGMVGGSIIGQSIVGGLVGRNDGTVSRSYVTGAVNGLDYVGGLVGRNDGTVSRSYVTGAVNGLTNVGGLVGYNDGNGTVSQSYATGVVNGSNYVGGLVGDNNGTVSQSYANGAVNGSNEVGGLVGGNDGTVSQSYATGAVSGVTNVGGLVGISDGTVSQSYANGAVNGSNEVGGLVGFNGGTVSQSYATGAVSGAQDVGGLVGISDGTVSESYWDTQTTGQTIGIGGGSTAGATGLTTAAARNSANYASWDFAGIWYQAGDMRPILRSEAAVPVAGVITVSNLHQLELVNINLLGSYRLTADIDASLTSSSNPAGIFGPTGFAPIGNFATPFTGSLTGAGHVISSLFINQPSIYYIGLVGYLGSAGTISRIGMVGGSITGQYFVGGLVGYSYGTVSQSYADAIVNGSYNVGGLVGFNNNGTVSQSYATGVVNGSGTVGGLVGFNNNGTVSQSYATGPVNGSDHVGGLVGYSHGGTVSQSYATGAVNGANGSSDVGGLVGYNSQGTVSQSYATGAVSGSDYVGGLVGEGSGTISQSYATGAVNGANGSAAVGGLVGYSHGGTVSQSYWNTQTTGQTTGIGGGSTAGATGLTTGQMQDVTLFRTTFAGFDFDTVWAPPSDAAHSSDGLAHYPELYALSNIVGVIAGGTHLYGDSMVANYLGLHTGDFVTVPGTSNVNASSTANIGSYAVFYSGVIAKTASGGAYRIVYVPGTENITARPITLTADAITRTYGDANPLLTYTVGGSGLVNGDTLTGGLATTATPASNVNGYAITQGNLAASSNYAVTYQGATLTVTPRALTITPDALSRLYGDANPASGTATANNLVNGDSVTQVSLTTPATVTSNVGNFDLTGSAATGRGLGNYTITYATLSGGLGITARPITLTADAITRIYGDANPLLTYTVGGSGLVNGDTLTGGLATTATPASNVNGYAITQGNLAASSNYAVTYQGGTLTVTPRALTVTPDALSRIYGDTNPLLTYTVGGLGLVNGDALTGGLATTATPASNVNGYAITQGNLAASSNYAVTYQGATLTVTPRALTVTPDALSRIYGAANPASGTATANNLVNGDSVTQVSLTTPATVTSNVGNFDLTGSAATGIGLGNYTITYATRSLGLGIIARPITLTADGISRIYGDANPLLTYTVGGLGLVNGDTLTGGLATTATATSNVNGYAITQGNLAASSNYAVTYQGATLTVTPRALTITPDALSRLYGDANPASGTATANNLVNGDSVTQVSLTTPATVTSNVGNFDLTGSAATGRGLGNYTITYATLSGGLGITARPITLTADAITRIYGDANPLLTYTVGGLGLVNGDTLTGGLATTATPASNVNGYAITQGNLAASSNYAVTYQGATLTVTPRALTVTPDALSRIYGDANPASGTATANNLVNGDSVTQVSLTTPATVTSNVGNFDLTGSAATGIGLGNYTITYATRSLGLGIIARPITLAADAIARIYGDTNPALTYTVGGSGLVNGDTLTGGLATTATATSNVNGYAITLGNLAASSNYAVTYQGATLTVTPRAIVITADDQLRYFGDANPVLTYTVGGSGLVNGDALSGALGVNAGRTSVPATYQIQKATLAASADYALTYIPGILTVQPSRPVPVALVASTLIRDAFATDTRPALYAASLVDSDQAQNGEKGVLTSSSKITPTFCPKGQICGAVELESDNTLQTAAAPLGG